MLGSFFHGFILSIGLILPLGPQNIFIFNQGAAHQKLRRTMPVVVTAALCDTILVLLAILGVSVVVMTIPELQFILYVLGFGFLIYIGWSIWQSNAEEVHQKHAAMSGRKQILFAVSVSLLNPHAVVDTVGVIGTNSIQYTEVAEKWAFGLACILVSWVAFVILALMGKTVRRLDQKGTMIAAMNKISAIFIWGVAAFIGYQILHII
ncbi:LysE/ArgO family amino acid transporter [Shouchella shacheensis]|uniref:LysE/ArgO family amino acid transporter n=1 Tax=Shouchella shacheensis TaxID=1649580 RepID=UPI00073FAE15|nr:LysE family transporter [Shouchella shacheensis]